MAKERIETIVERLGSPLAEELGYELVEVEYQKEGPDWILRCSIDKEAGIGIDDCQRFSEALEKLLDSEDPIPGKYLLEVSSPGIERPLKKEQDFIRFAGNQIQIKLVKPLNGQRVFQGELLGLTEANPDRLIKLKISESNMMEIPRNEVAKAHLISEIFGLEGGKKRK